jgi:hypothetical protein
VEDGWPADHPVCKTMQNLQQKAQKGVTGRSVLYFIQILFGAYFLLLQPARHLLFSKTKDLLID